MKIKEKHFLKSISFEQNVQVFSIDFYQYILLFILFDCTQHKECCMGELIKIIAAVDDDREENIENET